MAAQCHEAQACCAFTETTSIRISLTLLALGAAAYVLARRSTRITRDGRAAFAEGQPGDGPAPVRDASPDAMRDPPQGAWTTVDEASDQNFPASNPPAHY